MCTLSACYLSHEVSSDAASGIADAGTDGPVADAGRCRRGAACDCRAASMLPAGTHWIGVSLERTSSNPFISPAHRVVLTRDAWVGTFEASAGCYQRCIEAGACTDPELPPGLADAPRWVFGDRYWEEARSADRPIAGVTWDQATEYCAWLGGRLPTNAEWEKLARGTDGRGVPWEPAPLDPALPPDPSALALCAHAHRPDFGCSGEADDGALVAIDSHPQGVGPFGHFHVIGNAAEWVADTVAPYRAEDAVDPLDDVPGDERVIRSLFQGGWIRDSFDDFPSNRVPIGVRCAFDVEPEPLLR